MSTENKCCDELASLTEQLENLNSKLKEIKLKYQNALVDNLRKDLIILELRNKIEPVKFSSYDGILTESVLSEMRLLDDSPKNDSLFMYLILNDIYGESLKDKNLSGKNKQDIIGGLIPPETKQLVKDLFLERIKSTPTTSEVDERSGNLNKYIRNAIEKAQREFNKSN